METGQAEIYVIMNQQINQIPYTSPTTAKPHGLQVSQARYWVRCSCEQVAEAAATGPARPGSQGEPCLFAQPLAQGLEDTAGGTGHCIN